jgi:hypothetical protein
VWSSWLGGKIHLLGSPQHQAIIRVILLYEEVFISGIASGAVRCRSRLADSGTPAVVVGSVIYKNVPPVG